MFYNDALIITSLYGMKLEVDPEHDRKLREAIEYLGDKYCLAKQVEKNNERLR